MSKRTQILFAGDVLALALVTVIGFAAHGEADLSFLPRMLAAFIPLTIAWVLLSPWFGLFQQEITSNPRQLWRPALAALFAAPFAAILRGLLLNASIIPVFAVALASTSALGMLVWRGVYFLVTRKSR